MELTNTINTLNDDGLPTHLTRLGWSSFFRDQLQGTNRELIPARIVGVRKNIYLSRHGSKEMLTTIAGRLFNEPKTSLPAIGDWVLLRDSIITSIFTRKNTLSRKASGGRTRKNNQTHADNQVIAANLDKVFIVCGLDRDFNLRRIERYLTLIYNCDLEPVIILTKSDLHQNPHHIVQDVEVLAFGVPVYPVSANDDAAVFQLANLISQGETAALIGSSGAGKSTLVNRLSAKTIQPTGEVGSRVGKGRHITTTRDLIVLPSGGMVIDNPGIREIALSIDAAGTESAFPDIEAVSQLCRFTDCSHTHEPGCRVLEEVACGKIPLSRLKNFQKLKSELTYHLQRENKGASRVEKERWKAVSQKAKSIKNRR